MYGIGGLLSISLLFFGVYQMSSVVGKVSYERPQTQSASVIVTNVPSADDDLEEGEEPLEEAIEEIAIKEPKEELIPAVEEAPIPNGAPTVEESSSIDSGTIAALQEQVNALLEQVADASAETSSSESAYFVTPSGTKIDANGNVVNNDEVVAQDTSDSEESSSQSETLPVGYYRLPSGAVMGPGGVIVDDYEVVQATEQEEQTQVTSLDYYITPSGQKIDRYGNIVE